MSTGLPFLNKLVFNALKPLVLPKVRRNCTFHVDIAPPCYSGPADSATVEEVCNSVIRPLLAAADECFVYGLDQTSELLSMASSILQPFRGKHRFDLSADCVTGIEALFAANHGQRGTVLFRLPAGTDFLPQLFCKCYDPWYYSNPGAGQTPSALQYAKRKIKESQDIFVLLSRNNGLEYVDIVAAPQEAVRLFKQACWRATFRLNLWGE